MKNHLIIDPYLLTYCKVRRRGKIFPWGAVQILGKQICDDSENEYDGLIVWSEKLLPFGNNDHFAKISNKKIIVFRRRGRRKMAVIHINDLFTPTVWVSRVARNGYISTVGAVGMMFDPKFRTNQSIEATSKILEAAANGVRPPGFDNGSFVQVSPKFHGQDLIEVSFELGSHRPYGRLVFTQDGKCVIASVDTPLSYKRWGAENQLKAFGVGFDREPFVY